MARREPRPSRPYQYMGRKHLTSWLRDTAEGQAIVKELQADPREWLYGSDEGRAEQDAIAERYGKPPRHVPQLVIEISQQGGVRAYTDCTMEIYAFAITNEEGDTPLTRREKLPRRLQRVYLQPPKAAACVDYGPFSDLWHTEQVQAIANNQTAQAIQQCQAAALELIEEIEAKYLDTIECEPVRAIPKPPPLPSRRTPAEEIF